MAFHLNEATEQDRPASVTSNLPYFLDFKFKISGHLNVNQKTGVFNHLRFLASAHSFSCDQRYDLLIC